MLEMKLFELSLSFQVLFIIENKQYKYIFRVYTVTSHWPVTVIDYSACCLLIYEYENLINIKASKPIYYN